MTDLLDLLAGLDPAPPAPIAPPRQPLEPIRQPEAAIRQPEPPARQPWRYVAPSGTPAGLIAFACLCGARDERPAPSLDNVTCWGCRQPGAMRPLPWRATDEEWARGPMI